MHDARNPRPDPSIEISEGDIEDVSECPVCGGRDTHVCFPDLHDTEEGVGGTWSMAKCAQCCSLFLSSRLREGALYKAYGTYYTHSADDSGNLVVSAGGWTSRVVRSYLAFRHGVPFDDASRPLARLVALARPLALQLDYLMRNVPPSRGRLLDVGCGNGGFLLRARQAGWKAMGVEPDPMAARVARQVSGVEVLETIESVDRECFDFVTLSHVIEHVHRPLDLLRGCCATLRGSGEIWIATPNIASIGSRVFGPAWQPLEVPRHLVMPSASGLQCLLGRAGFVDVRFIKRGRGAHKRLLASCERARLLGRKAPPAMLLSPLVDLAASISAFAGEEIVVMARKP